MHIYCIGIADYWRHSKGIVFVVFLLPTVLFVNFLHQVHYPVCEAILIVKPQDYLDCSSVNLKHDI